MQMVSADSYSSKFFIFSLIGRKVCWHFFSTRQMVLLISTVLLLLASFSIASRPTEAHSATPGAGYACSWHHVVAGDTLGYIASAYRANIWNMAQVNHIRNINLIFVGQNLCIAHQIGHPINRLRNIGGRLAQRRVAWYAYNQLDWSNRAQVTAQLRQAAARHGLSANLLLAIAWQESGWNQHVISRDGGIGVMQLMPYTAYGLNIQTRIAHNPYRLSDNIELGAIYLRTLMNGFHGNLTYVISAYNEGGWNVQHRGIFNWRYVNNVRSLMYRL